MNSVDPVQSLHSVMSELNFRIFSVIGWSCFFSLPKQSKNLDPSYKMDLDLWDCLGRVKLVF